MLIEPKFETYRYTGEMDCLHSQSMVECRFPGSEIGGILAVQATAVPTECVCADGEVRYGGKVLLCVVYEDVDKKICRVERGAEFFHKAEGQSVSPACFAKAAFSVDNVTHRREGSGLYVSVVVGALLNVYGSKQMEYLSGGENVETDVGDIRVCKRVCVTGETEMEDEFEMDYVGDILLHSENAVVTRVGVGAGQLNIEGELTLNVCVLKSDESVCSYERLLPFALEIPCEEAFGDTQACARAVVKSTQLSCAVDEEKGKSKVVFSYVLSADCFLSQTDSVSVAKDAFSPLVKTRLIKEKGEGRYLTNSAKYTERIGGEAVLLGVGEGEYVLEAAILPRGEVVCKRTAQGVEVEGVVLAEVILRGVDGGRKSCPLSLPFLFPIDMDGDSFEADCIVYGLNVRRKNGVTEAEATVKICVKGYKRCAWEYIRDVEEGEKVEKSDAAVSIFVPVAGETLWEVAKRLSRTREDLQKSNPDLVFPVKEGERIFVYRQIK